MAAEKPDFAFVVDRELRALLEDYYSQGEKAFAADSYLGTIVACGSVVEGLLTWALLLHEDHALKSTRASKDNQGKAKPLREWNISNLIAVAVDLKLIGRTAEGASWALRDFRNFIHPYNLLRQSARPDKALAMSAMAAVSEIARSLAGRLSK